MNLDPGWLERDFARIEALKRASRKIQAAAAKRKTATIKFSAAELDEINQLTKWF